MGISAFPYTAVLDVSANTLLGNNTGSSAAAIALTATQVRTLLSVYTSAEVDTLLAAYQPLDGDLTAIAALTTTAFGRSLLTLADGAATRTAIGAGTSSFSGSYGDLSGVPATFTPASHTHGNITNAGAIGATASLPIITGASGVLTAGAFGTTSGTFCEGNDSRLADQRTPTAHKTNHATGGSDALTAADIGAAATSHTHAASDITSGTIATPRLASGTADATTFLRGDQTWAVPSGGITSLNSLTTATQTFAIGTSGSNVAFSSASGVHTLNIPDASASARGVITTGTQTIAGKKTLSEVHVVGSSNLTQIDITPASSQSVNQQIWRTSAGAAIGVIDSAGRPVFGSGSWTLNSAFHAVAWYGATIGWSSAGIVTGTSTHDTGLVRDGGAGIVGLRASTTAHTLRIYNTYTSATSFDRLNIAWASISGTPVCTIETDNAGGTLKGLRIGGSASALLGMYGATPIVQPTTAVDSASHELFAGNTLSDADTYDGYTIAQVVKALRNLGVLA